MRVIPESRLVIHGIAFDTSGRRGRAKLINKHIDQLIVIHRIVIQIRGKAERAAFGRFYIHPPAGRSRFRPGHF
ncbi:hypothetical protein D3C71_2078710 [compost metagenome]